MNAAGLARMLAKATTRLEILRGRMAACDAGDRTDTGHQLSRFEIDGWVEEQRDVLNEDATPTGLSHHE